jgi:hypothetical protein
MEDEVNDSKIAVAFAVVAILGTAFLLFRQRALTIKALVAAVAATLIVGGFVFMTL